MYKQLPILGALLTLTGFSASLHAATLSQVQQTVTDALTNPSTVPSPQARAVGVAVGNICPQGQGNFNLITLGDDLQPRCNELANVAQGANAATAGDALLQWSPEEVATQGTTSIDVSNAQLKAVGGRLAALRAGAKGLNIGGIDYDTGGRMIARRGGSTLGGAAGADDAGFGRWGGFFNGGYQFGDKDASALESGFEFDNRNLVVGVDYRVNDAAVVGAAFGYTRSNADIDLNGGDLEADNYDVSLYGSFYPTDAVYIDASVTRGWSRFDQRRNTVYNIGTAVNQTFTSKPDGSLWSGSLTTGYQANMDSLTFGPYVRYTYTRSEVDAFRETPSSAGPGSGLALAVGKQKFRSSTLDLGAQASVAVSTDWGVLVPMASLEYSHEFSNKAGTINANFVNDPTATVFSLGTDAGDKNYFKAGAGVSALFSDGYSAFIAYQGLIGYKKLSSHDFTGGLRVEF